jgi:hypothetical protein
MLPRDAIQPVHWRADCCLAMNCNIRPQKTQLPLLRVGLFTELFPGNALIKSVALFYIQQLSLYFGYSRDSASRTHTQSYQIYATVLETLLKIFFSFTNITTSDMNVTIVNRSMGCSERSLIGHRFYRRQVPTKVLRHLPRKRPPHGTTC